MVPLVVLVAAFSIFFLSGRLGVRPLFESWVTCLRWALAASFLVAAGAHFSSLRPDLVRMVPPMFERPELLVTLTGLAQVAGAVGLLFRRTAPWAASMLALVLIGIFPASVYAAYEHLTIGGRPVPGIAASTFMLFVFMAALVAAGFTRRLGPHARRHRPHPAH